MFDKRVLRRNIAMTSQLIAGIVFVAWGAANLIHNIRNWEQFGTTENMGALVVGVVLVGVMWLLPTAIGGWLTWNVVKQSRN